MIRIIEDPGKLIRKSNAKRLEVVGHYPVRVQEILDALRKHKNYTMIVNHTTAARWLRNMAERYPQGTFIFEIEDARGALAKAWGIAVPSDVSNEDILQANLLNLPLHPQPGDNFEDTLLASFYSPILTLKEFPFDKLPALLGTYDPVKWQANLAISLLPRTLHQRIGEWRDKVRSEEQRQLIGLYSSNPAELERLLAQFQVLRGYPELGEVVMGEDFTMIKSMKLPLEDLKVDDTKLPDAVHEVIYFLNAQNPKDENDLKILLSLMSGLLSVELEQIEKHLMLHPEWMTTEMADLISEKFGGQPRFMRSITALRGLIRPTKPEFPDLEWDVDNMLTWAIDEYLPYQAWCDENNEFDFDLYEIGDKFSEWLMGNWSDLRANSKRMVFNILPNYAAELKQCGAVNLFLVIDNLGWTYSELLQRLFKEHGLHLSDKQPYMAMLPTETETSKKCLLAGITGYKDINEGSYKTILEKGWVPFFNDHKFQYVSDIGSLDRIETIEATTYVVNYLAVDNALHKSEDEFGMPHREHIQHLLKKLVEKVALFIEKHELGDRARVYVVSDHGSTRIPEEARNDIDQAYFKSDGFETRSHRYLSVRNDRFAALPDNHKVDCFFLPAIDFWNREDILCARRGNRFLKTDQRYYVHGGLLPEEVVVPFLRFEPALVAIQNLTIKLKSNEFRYRKQTVELEIGNPNNIAVEQIQVSLLNGNVDSDPVTIALLAGGMKTTVPMEAKFGKTSISNEQEHLQVRVRFSANNQQFVKTEAFDIVMKSMMDYKATDIFDV